MEIKAILLSNRYDKKEMKFLISSLRLNKIKADFAGLNEPWDFINKIYWTWNYLNKYFQNDILIFSDAFDVFYLKNLIEIKNKFLQMKTKILFSAETCYSHQLDEDKEFYDCISQNVSKYRYLNTGCFIGFRKELFLFYSDLIKKIENKNFMREIRTLKSRNDGIDQTIISHHIAQNYDSYDLKLDYNNNIFYVASVDWDDIDSYVLDDMTIKETNNRPCLIHVPFKRKYEHILSKLFFRRYKIRIF